MKEVLLSGDEWSVFKLSRRTEAALIFKNGLDEKDLLSLKVGDAELRSRPDIIATVKEIGDINGNGSDVYIEEFDDSRLELVDVADEEPVFDSKISFEEIKACQTPDELRALLNERYVHGLVIS
jgi:hypothetical protein